VNTSRALCLLRSHCGICQFFACGKIVDNEPLPSIAARQSIEQLIASKSSSMEVAKNNYY
jgi:hypothetical protein